MGELRTTPGISNIVACHFGMVPGEAVLKGWYATITCMADLIDLYICFVFFVSSNFYWDVPELTYMGMRDNAKCQENLPISDTTSNPDYS